MRQGLGVRPPGDDAVRERVGGGGLVERDAHVRPLVAAADDDLALALRFQRGQPVAQAHPGDELELGVPLARVLDAGVGPVVPDGAGGHLVALECLAVGQRPAAQAQALGADEARGAERQLALAIVRRRALAVAVPRSQRQLLSNASFELASLVRHVEANGAEMLYCPS